MMQHKFREIDIADACRRACQSIETEREQTRKFLSEVFTRMRMKLLTPIVISGGKKSIFWWKNTLKYDIVFTIPDRNSKTIQLDIKYLAKNLDRCSGMYTLTTQRLGDGQFDQKCEYRMTAQFSSNKDAVYFKMLWSGKFTSTAS